MSINFFLLKNKLKIQKEIGLQKKSLKEKAEKNEKKVKTIFQQKENIN